MITGQATESVDTLLGEIANEFSQRLADGENPSIEEYAEKHPHIAQMIRAVFPALDLLKSDGQLAPAEFSPSKAKSLGDYHIIRELGRGGMGVVYEAEQVSLGRTVALKVLPYAAVMDQKAITRFKNEARAAATLDHPNIVPVIAVGNERGVYYYAMSLIDGMTLAEVIAALRRRVTGDAKGTTAGLSIDDILSDRSESSVVDSERESSGLDETLESGSQGAEADEGVAQEAGEPTDREVQAAVSTHRSLFSPAYYRNAARLGMQAAEALDHAHQHGVVHRDIKPGNLMIDHASKLWITDFGLARIESDPGMTITGDLIGTLRYMAPEQALAQRVIVDHRADVYALGVTLYELLTLRPAYDGRDREQLMRQIALEEPKPLRQLNRAVPRDLETIISKAIAKNPDERYATAQALADDLRSFLDYQPIKAQPPSAGERVIKWSRRHRSLVWSVAVSTALLLLISIAVLASSNRVVAQQRVIAEQESATAEAVIEFISDDLLGAADPMNEPDREIKLRSVVDRASMRIKGRFRGQPLVAAKVCMTLGRTYQSLGEYDSARTQYQFALRIYLKELGPEHVETLECQRRMATLLIDLGNDVEAESLLRTVFELQVQKLGDGHPNTLQTMSDIATLCLACGRPIRARRLSHFVLQRRVANLSPSHPLVLQATHEHGLAMAELGEMQQAVDLFREAYEGRHVELGPGHPDTLDSWFNLLSIRWELGHRQTSSEDFRKLLTTVSALLGPDHPRSLLCKQRLALVCIGENKPDEAAQLLANARVGAIAKLGGTHELVLQIDYARGRCHAALRQHSKAREIFGELLEQFRSIYGESHPYTSVIKTELANAYDGLGWTDEARQLRAGTRHDGSAENLTAIMPMDSPVSRRRMTRAERHQETSVTEVEDFLRGHDARLNRGAIQVEGVVGQALLFDGIDSKAVVADSPDFAFDKSLAISCWVRVDSFPSSGHGLVLFRGDDRAGLDPYHLTTTPSGQIQFMVSNLTEGATSLNAAMPQGELVYVAATLDDATGKMSLYLNGVLMAETVTSVRPFKDLDPNFNPGIGIGNHSGNPVTSPNAPFHGLIDELKVHDLPLSEADVLSNYYACQTPPPSISISDASVIEGDERFEFDSVFVSAGSGGLKLPRTVQFGPDGNLYVASAITNEVLRYDRTGGALIDAFVPACSGGLDFPAGMAFGPDGHLYVSSKNNDAVLRYDGTTGAFINEFVTPGSGGLDVPIGLAFGPAGDLYVASRATDSVLRYDGATGRFSVEFVAARSGGLGSPFHLAFGRGDHLLVSSDTLGSVFRFDGSTGGYIDTFIPASSGGTGSANWLEFGPDGLLYVSHKTNDAILRYDGATGILLDTFVSSGSGGVKRPWSFTFGADGNLYVCSGATNEILRFTTASNATLVVNLSAPRPDEVTVTFNTSDGSAVAGSDYSATTGRLTFAAGQTSRSIVVPILNDAIFEANETFSVTLSSPTNATISGGLGEVTIAEREIAKKLEQILHVSDIESEPNA